MNIIKKVFLTIEGYDLLRQGETVVVGVSGGADSVAALEILRDLNDSQGYDWKIVIAHLNHGLRGTESDGDEEFVRAIAAKHGLVFVSRKVDVRKIREKEKMTLEAAGRKARHDFLIECAVAANAQKIILAHTMDDQAETILHRIIRGSGLRGLKGITPIRKMPDRQELFIVRPMIEVERIEIEQFLASRDIAYRVDSTNTDISLTRNRIRLKVIPQIEEDFNPRFKASLIKLGQTAASSYILLREIAKEVYENIKMLGGEGEVCLSVEEFVKTPPALQTLIIDRAVRAVYGSLPQLHFEHYLDILSLCTDQGFSKTVTLPKGLRVRRESYILKISKARRRSTQIRMKQQSIAVPGKTSVEQLRVIIETMVARRDDVKLQEYFAKKDYSEELIDYDKVRSSLALRLKKAGDAFRPLGFTGTCKLKKFFIDNKVPREARDNVPIVVDHDRIVWVVGYRIADEYRVTEETKNVLMLKVRKL